MSPPDNRMPLGPSPGLKVETVPTRLIETKCKTCGAEFCVRLEGRGTAPGFCSDECRFNRAADRERARAEKVRGPARSVTAPCEFCTKTFTQTLYGRGRPVSYCSSECRAGRQRANVHLRRRQDRPCASPGCDQQRPPGRKFWCEKHYGRLKRNGDLDTLLVRLPNGACHHCDNPTDSPKKLFCSAICRRRDRLGLPGTVLTCHVCQGDIHEDRRCDSIFCSKTCLQVAQRAKLYKISVEEMLALFREADGLCTICRDREPSHIDHCHTSGRVRGFICGQCNTGLGMFRDSPEFLRAAARYLELNTPVLTSL